MMKEINIDGQTYLVDVDLALKQGLLKVKKTYQTGQKFTLTRIGANEEYMIVTPLVGYACIINMQTGVRWTDMCSVNNVWAITEDEFRVLTGSEPELFKQIS